MAWNNNSKYIQLEYGQLAIYNGDVTAAEKRAVFDERGNHFYRDGYYVGKIGTNEWSGNDAHKGLVFDLDYQGKYMTSTASIWAVTFMDTGLIYTMSICTTAMRMAMELRTQKASRSSRKFTTTEMVRSAGQHHQSA